MISGVHGGYLRSTGKKKHETCIGCWRARSVSVEDVDAPERGSESSSPPTSLKVFLKKCATDGPFGSVRD